jgi:hypothetical protein
MAALVLAETSVGSSDFFSIAAVIALLKASLILLKPGMKLHGLAFAAPLTRTSLPAGAVTSMRDGFATPPWVHSFIPSGPVRYVSSTQAWSLLGESVPME